MDGLHILAEFYACDCAPALMHEAVALQRTCREVCSEAGLCAVGHVFHEFGTPGQPAGATGAVVLAESHIAVHTWPERGAVTLDIYVCNFSQDNRAAAEAAFRALVEVFHPHRIVRRDVQRGEALAAACLHRPD